MDKVNMYFNTLHALIPHVLSPLCQISTVRARERRGGGGPGEVGGLVIHAHMCLPVPLVTGPGGGAHDKLPSTGDLRAQPP